MSTSPMIEILPQTTPGATESIEPAWRALDALAGYSGVRSVHAFAAYVRSMNATVDAEQRQLAVREAMRLAVGAGWPGGWH
jgi:hypothetical protein